MTSLRCFVVDDEPLAVKMLENFIERTPFLELAGSFTDPVLALSEIRTQAPQLVFLDIQMPDLSGMELSRMIPDGTRIIFTTAFKQYAFESYEAHSLSEVPGSGGEGAGVVYAERSGLRGPGFGS